MAASRARCLPATCPTVPHSQTQGSPGPAAGRGIAYLGSHPRRAQEARTVARHMSAVAALCCRCGRASGGQLRPGGEHDVLRDPASSRCSSSAAHPSGKYKARPIKAWPRDVAKVNVTATWHSATPPAVPLYWRAAPAQSAEDFSSAVSSTISTASPIVEVADCPC
jgi:hypothetical protein